MHIELIPKSVFRNLSLFVIFLLLANIVGLIFKFYFGRGTVYGFVPLFNFNTEKNVPTFFSSFILISCAILLYIIAINHKRLASSYLPWMGLSFVFLFLAIDEVASLHERIRGFNTSGLFYFAWIIPYGIALVIFLIIYLKFLFQLPKKTRILFILSGTLFVLGAIGFEMLGAQEAEINGYKSLQYSIYYTFEELFEMLGIVLFIYTLLSYITYEFDYLTVTVTVKEVDEA